MPKLDALESTRRQVFDLRDQLLSMGATPTMTFREVYYADLESLRNAKFIDAWRLQLLRRLERENG